MNFENGSSLASFQDYLIKKYAAGQPATKSEINRLKDNYWVKTASSTAPSNLVVRHWALIDLFTVSKSYELKIIDQIKKIFEGLWLEGYSYWKYTKPCLVFYYQNLVSSKIKDYVRLIDENFVKSAYIGADGLKWPAPFGDLRKEPLEQSLQEGTIENIFTAGFLNKSGLFYKVKARYLGMNTHTPKNSDLVIENGIPLYSNGKEFGWYEGYDKKYTDKASELKDTFSVKRVFSLFK